MYCTVVILAVFICEIRGKTSPEKCPELTVQQNFDLNKYLGKWYVQATYPSKLELPGKCISSEFTMTENGTVKVVNSQIFKHLGRNVSVEGTARQDEETTDGKLILTFDVKEGTRDSPYWVVSTDYDSYAVAWSCSEVENKANFISLRFVWLMTRMGLPPSDIMNKMYDVLDKSKIKRERLILSDQNDCD